MAARDSDPGDDDAGAELYDAYVEAVLSGSASDPDTFLADHPEASDELRASLRAVWSASGRGDGGERGLPFERLGDYRLLRALDSGGMGAVYLAEDARLGRLAALKLLRPELQGSATLAARFEREAQVVARLRHPNIVTLFGVGHDQGVRFLAMEYVEGEGLDEVIARTRDGDAPPPVATCVRWAAQIAGALQAAHEAGVVHRDVKPANIRIRPNGEAVLLDFGIAAEAGSSALTRTGRMLGTAGYAAPEQVGGSAEERTDARTDVHGLGVVLFELLTGVHPFGDGTESAVIARVLREPPPSLRALRPAVPRDLETVVQVALAKNPGRRYPTAAALADDLAAVLAVRPIVARRAGPVRRLAAWGRRRPAVAALLASAVVGLLVWSVAGHVQRRAEGERALREARTAVDRFRDELDSGIEAEATRVKLDALLEAAHLTPEQDAAWSEAGATVRTSRRRREALFHDALQHLADAERLGRDTDETAPVRAALYLQRWREARAAKDETAAAFYRQRVQEADPGGALSAEVDGTARLRIRCDVPDVDIRVFVVKHLPELVPDGEPRNVPVPLSGPDPLLPPGAWAFRMLRDHGGLEAEDLVVAVEGERPGPGNWRALRERVADGASVTVIGRERRGEFALSPGAPLRVTTVPLPWTATTATAATHVGDEIVVPSDHLLVVLVRVPGREPERLFAGIESGRSRELIAAPAVTGTSPPGFVRVVHPHRRHTTVSWIGETEVTAGQYLEFVNDPDTLRRIDALDEPALFPRNDRNAAERGHWPRGADGRFALPASWTPDWPVVGVSYADALAYCDWWTRRAEQRGLPYEARLPTMDDWVSAATCGGASDFVFGNTFLPKWVNSCFSRPKPGIEPVLRYPRDESLMSVFDLSGSVFEWIDDWWDEAQGARRVGGGAWSRATRETFKVWGGEGRMADDAGNETGFRIVLVPRDDR